MTKLIKNIYDEIGRPSIKYYKQIRKLTEQLDIFYGIDRFWRNSHRKDGSYSVLGNHPPVAECFFGQNLYMGHPYFRNPIYFQTGYALPELLNSREYEATQGKLRREGDCHHVLIHIRKEANGFVEYGFATSKPQLGFETVYLNHLRSIGKFIEFFETYASQLIHEADDCSIDISKVIGSKYHENPKLVCSTMVPEEELRFLAALERNKEKEKAFLSLTKSEKVCLRHYLSGNSTQEIAKKLFRSPRTIETHLENAKGKLAVTSRSALFELLMPLRDFL